MCNRETPPTVCKIWLLTKAKHLFMTLNGCDDSGSVMTDEPNSALAVLSTSWQVSQINQRRISPHPAKAGLGQTLWLLTVVCAWRTMLDYISNWRWSWSYMPCQQRSTSARTPQWNLMCLTWKSRTKTLRITLFIHLSALISDKYAGHSELRAHGSGPTGCETSTISKGYNKHYLKSPFVHTSFHNTFNLQLSLQYWPS